MSVKSSIKRHLRKTEKKKEPAAAAKKSSSSSQAAAAKKPAGAGAKKPASKKRGPVEDSYAIWPSKNPRQNEMRQRNMLLESNFGQVARRGVIERRFYRQVGRWPNLDNPQSFNEKLNWMKLYYRNPLMTECVDKVSFKNYIARTVGEEYVVPLYGVWENVNDIDFDALPDTFAIKSSWGWGAKQVILVKDKTHVDQDRIKAECNEWLMPWNNYYYASFEWDSKDVKPAILAEEYLRPESGGIVDYKFYCYGGVCRHFLVCKDRTTRTKYINYDRDYNCIAPSPKSYVDPEKFQPTDTFEKMLDMAEKLSEPFPFVRVDFYDIDGKIYVGELTFTPGGGLNTYTAEWDYKFGSYLTLPEANADPE